MLCVPSGFSVQERLPPRLWKMGPLYTQTYRKSWESLPELKDWLRPVSTSVRSYCFFCKCELAAKLSDLQNHAKAKKHVKGAEPFLSAV